MSPMEEFMELLSRDSRLISNFQPLNIESLYYFDTKKLTVEHKLTIAIWGYC